MQQRHTLAGFAILNVLLGVALLAGIIYLIMHAMSNFHSQESDGIIGEELSSVITQLLVLDGLSDKTAASYHLVSDATLCTNGDGLLKHLPTAYLQSLKTSGFDLCSATVVISN